jgi:hypothetical protein
VWVRGGGRLMPLTSNIKEEEEEEGKEGEEEDG